MRNKFQNVYSHDRGLFFTSGLTMLILLMVVLYPLAALLMYSLGINVHDSGLTGIHYLQAISDIKTFAALKNTFYVAAGVTLLSVLLGGGLAWLITRTDIPFKRSFKQIGSAYGSNSFRYPACLLRSIVLLI